MRAFSSFSSWSALAAFTVGAAGCTSLLGDFTAGPDTAEGGSSESGASSSGGMGSDGSSGGMEAAVTDDGGDATVQGDGAAPTDAPVEAEAAAPLQQLTCATWDHPNPTLVMKLFPSDSGGGGNNMPFNQFMVEHIPGMNAARLVVATSVSMGSQTSVVTVSENGGSGAVSTLTLTGTNLEFEQKTSTGVAFLVQNFMANQYEYYSIADTDPGAVAAAIVGPAPAITAPPGLLTGSGGGNFQMEFVPLTGGGYYTLASYPTTSVTFDLASLLAGARIWGHLQGPGMFQQLGPLVPDGTNVYGFLPPAGMGNNGPSAIDMYTFSAAGSPAPTTRSIVAAGSSAATAAATAVTGGYALAFVEVGGAQQAALKVGMVPQAKINTFMIDDLGSLQFNVQSDGGFFDTTPFSGRNGSFARWLSNGHLGIMGGGGTGGGGSYTGLNFYVATQSAQWLVETAGSGKNVLPGKSIVGSAFDLAQAVGEIVLKFDIAWIEQDASGAYSLYFNVLDCNL